MSIEKQEQVRQIILDYRKALSPDEIASVSDQIISRFLAYSEIQDWGSKKLSVGMYRAVFSEVSLRPLEESLRKMGWSIHFPRIIDQDAKEMEFAENSGSADSESNWKVGPYGIHEPHPDLEAVSPDKLDLIFIPGVAFGQAGERIGLGKGYYDRFLAKAPQALRVALAFDFQVVESLDQNTWDQPVHWIFTEKREFKMPFVDSWQKRGTVE